jgi:trimeric autotransporter adhesin
MLQGGTSSDGANFSAVNSSSYTYNFGVGGSGFYSGNMFFIYNANTSTFPFGITSTGKVGIGTMTPQAFLDVSGAIRIADTGANCNSSSNGAIRFNSITHVVQYCYSLAWSNVASAGGAPALSSITAAIGANTINSAANAQEWDWNSLSTGNGLTLGSTSVTSGNVLFVSSNHTTLAGAAIKAQIASTTTNGAAIYGHSTGTSGTVYGVEGDSASASGAAVYGSNTATAGVGVEGVANTGAAYGVEGTTSSTTTNAAAVYGNASGNGTEFGGYFTTAWR